MADSPDLSQALRIQAAAQTAQVLAGSGADPKRWLELYWTIFFTTTVAVPAQPAVAGNEAAKVASLRLVDGAEKPSA